MDSEHQRRQNVNELENEAFNRGLPENEARPEPTKAPGWSNPDPWQAAKLDPPTAFKKSPVILLIDDEEAFRSVIRQVLLKAGYEVVEAANGVEAIHRFYEKPADMIITDIIMPEKEGIETIMDLRRQYGDVKIIAIDREGKVKLSRKALLVER